MATRFVYLRASKPRVSTKQSNRPFWSHIAPSGAVAESNSSPKGGISFVLIGSMVSALHICGIANEEIRYVSPGRFLFSSL